jgi:hypothetical protein
MTLDRRLGAVRELMIADMRENAGMHEYDGIVQDLSETGVLTGLAALGGPHRRWHLSHSHHHHQRNGHSEHPAGQALGSSGSSSASSAGSAASAGSTAEAATAESASPDERHDDAHLSAFEAGLHWYFGEYQAHRRDPLIHLSGLDLACYDREYAPLADRRAARAKHLALWPAAIDVAVSTLDAVPAPVATSLLPAVRGLAAALDEPHPSMDDTVIEAARTAHARLVAHLEQSAVEGDPDCSVGAQTLAGAMGAFEAVDPEQPIDLTELAERADSERNRLLAILAEACSRLEPHLPTAQVVTGLLQDHPDIDGVILEARAVTDEVLAFTRKHDLAPWTDGECLVGPAPESRKWAMAMMSWAGPEEPDAPSWYHVTPPEPDWPAEEISEWLATFSRTTLPAITVHEVSPGHYAHSRSLRRLTSPVRRQLIGGTFTEGWAHYTEEMVAEEGFRADDPRYLVGMALEALVRVTRLSCSIGLHTGALDVDGATERFRADAYLGGSAARSEAQRGTFDIGYGRYTQGKLAIQDLRERARAQWGADFSLPRLHGALLQLGAPPIGLIDAVL